MTMETIRERYERAQEYFASGRVTAALHLLETIEQSYPNFVDVLYARALCLESLGRLREARVVCNKLINVFGDSRAGDLRARIEVRLRSKGRRPRSHE